MSGRYTRALKYSRWERLVFRLTGRWPDAVVERRLMAAYLDRAEADADEKILRERELLYPTTTAKQSSPEVH